MTYDLKTPNVRVGGRRHIWGLEVMGWSWGQNLGFGVMGWSLGGHNLGSWVGVGVPDWGRGHGMGLGS